MVFLFFRAYQISIPFVCLKVSTCGCCKRLRSCSCYKRLRSCGCCKILRNCGCYCNYWDAVIRKSFLLKRASGKPDDPGGWGGEFHYISTTSLKKIYPFSLKLSVVTWWASARSCQSPLICISCDYWSPTFRLWAQSRPNFVVATSSRNIGLANN